MSIEEQFNKIANEYDANRRRFIPCFDDYYITATKFVLNAVDTPKRVLDLGAGTGLLSFYWYSQCNEAEYVLVDIADEMLNVSRQRFASLDNVSHLVLDYTKELPAYDFDAVISALSIHHLENESKKSLFKAVFEKLPAKGVFVNYDQFCAGNDVMNSKFDEYWEAQLYKSGLSDHDIQMWLERRKLDRECSVDEETAMLKEAGFSTVQCIYSYHKFSVIMAIK